MWSQILLIIWLSVGIAFAWEQHGQPHPPINVWDRVKGALILIGILWWGGFWDVFSS